MKPITVLMLVLAVSAVSAAQATTHSKHVAAGHWDIANIQSERVEYWVNRFAYGDKHDKIALYLSRKPHYEKMISRKLRERDMPQDLIYLAMVESGFNPKADSRARAVGIWQLCTGTARLYGLRVNKHHDDRLDPDKETDAALDFLQDLHRRYGSWYLAAAAYNGGQNRIARILKKSTGSVRGTDHTYYKVWHRLPGETRDYIPAMIAAARIGKDPAKYGFGTSGSRTRGDVIPSREDGEESPAKAKEIPRARRVARNDTIAPS